MSNGRCTHGLFPDFRGVVGRLLHASQIPSTFAMHVIVSTVVSKGEASYDKAQKKRLGICTISEGVRGRERDIVIADDAAIQIISADTTFATSTILDRYQRCLCFECQLSASKSKAKAFCRKPKNNARVARQPVQSGLHSPTRTI